MTDWDAKAHAAIDHIQSRKRTFPEGKMLDLVDFFAAKGAASEAEMQAHGSADFVLTVLGHVTTAVHGGGPVPKEAGWYRHPSGEPYRIDPDFAKAWVKERGGMIYGECHPERVRPGHQRVPVAKAGPFR